MKRFSREQIATRVARGSPNGADAGLRRDADVAGARTRAGGCARLRGAHHKRMAMPQTGGPARSSGTLLAEKGSRSGRAAFEGASETGAAIQAARPSRPPRIVM